MSTARVCACCSNVAVAGKLLCEKCKAHAAELERVRLHGLERQPHPTGPGFVMHGRRHGKTLALASIGLALACAGPSRVPCDARDTPAHTALAVELAECRSKIDACTTTVCVDEVEAACNAAADARCKEPSP